ncbi:MAG: site-specific integrase [bacterium]|nr:site-specific integrase [bacterium]
MAYIEERQGKRGVRYRALVRMKGSPAQSRTFATKTRAQTWARGMEAAIDEGRALPGAEAQRRTVGELIERYIRDVLPSRPERDRDRVAKQLRFFLEHLGTFHLMDLTPDRIAECRDRLARGDSPSGRPLSAGTQNRYLAALSHACTVAVKEWRWLTENPVRHVRRPREPRGRVRFLSDDERNRLLEACAVDDRLLFLVVMAIATAARQGELVALRWRDLDLIRGQAVLLDTKNGESRSAPVTGRALEMARERQGPDSAAIFAGPNGRGTFPRKAWEAAKQAAGLEDFRFHDLRHTGASYLAMSGATLGELAAILGHQTLAMVKRYAHLTEQHTHTVAERMTARFLD